MRKKFREWRLQVVAWSIGTLAGTLTGTLLTAWLMRKPGKEKDG